MPGDLFRELHNFFTILTHTIRVRAGLCFPNVVIELDYAPDMAPATNASNKRHHFLGKNGQFVTS